MSPPQDRPSVLAKAPGSYREFSPPLALRGHFSCVWVHVVPGGLDEPLPVVPDGRADLQWFNGQLRVAGPDKSVNHERVPAGATIIGFRFRPGAASQWLRVPMSSLVDQRVELTDLWGRGVRDTGDALASAGEAEVVAKLGAYLQDRARSVLPPDRMAQDIFDALAVDVATDGEITRSLTTSLGISPRGLRRHTLATFGYGPKTLHRILRFQGFIRAAQAQGPRARTLAALAVDGGYSDQPHLCRECAEMTGMTPSAVLNRLRAQ